jgi:hypothetical protein
VAEVVAACVAAAAAVEVDLVVVAAVGCAAALVGVARAECREVAVIWEVVLERPETWVAAAVWGVVSMAAAVLERAAGLGASMAADVSTVPGAVVLMAPVVALTVQAGVGSMARLAAGSMGQGTLRVRATSPVQISSGSRTEGFLVLVPVAAP